MSKAEINTETKEYIIKQISTLKNEIMFCTGIFFLVLLLSSNLKTISDINVRTLLFIGVMIHNVVFIIVFILLKHKKNQYVRLLSAIINEEK